MVDLRINNKTYKYQVSRLTAITWIPNPDNLPIINHKDNNPLNNNIDNLEWCTYSYNNYYSVLQGRHHYDTAACHEWHYAPKTYLHKRVCQYTLNGEYIKTFDSITAAAKEVAPNHHRTGNISSCCKGKARTAYGYIWKYCDDENVTTKNAEDAA